MPARAASPLLALCATGCIYPHLRAGPAWSLSQPEAEPVVAATGAVDIVVAPQGPVQVAPKVVIRAWSPEQPLALGYGWAVRAKAGARLGQLAGGMHLSAQARLVDRVWAGARAGAHVVQLDLVAGQLGGAVGSPYVEGHVGVGLSRELSLFVSPWWEHDLRFGPAPDETFVGVALGLSWFPVP